MKLRSTLTLLVIVAAIGVYLHYFERSNPSHGEAVDRALHVVPDFERGRIDAISIKSPETKIELRRKPNGAWLMEEPARDRADLAAMTELLTAVDTLQNAAPPVELDPKDPKARLKEFGILDSTTKAKLTGGAKTLDLILGKDTAVEGSSYLYVEGEKWVRIVGSAFKAQLQKKADDFRDRKLADFGPMQVAKAEIKGPLGTVELTQKDKHWSITKPLQARGDDATIGDLLATALNARVLEFGSDLHLATSGVSDAPSTVTFWLEGVETPVVLSIGQNPKEEADKEKTWARLSSREALVLVPKAIEKILETKPDDVRDRNLLRVETDIVDRITIEPAGAEKLVLSRGPKSWVRKANGADVIINDLIPPQMLTGLQAMRVMKYISDVGTDLGQYGLDQPSLKVTLSSFSSENTPESKAGELPIVTVIFGKDANENEVYAKLDDEPFIVTVSRTSVGFIPTSAIQFQELTIFADPATDVTALQVTSTVQPALTVERDKDKNWKLVEGEGTPDQSAINNLITAFTRLRAVRWAGPKTEEHRLDKPGAVITVTVGQGDKQLTRKLSIGAASADLWAAEADGKTGVFEIGTPDRNLLAAPLTDKAAAAMPEPVIDPLKAGPGDIIKRIPLRQATPTPAAATPLPATPPSATPVPVPATPAPAPVPSPN